MPALPKKCKKKTKNTRSKILGKAPRAVPQITLSDTCTTSLVEQELRNARGADCCKADWVVPWAWRFASHTVWSLACRETHSGTLALNAGDFSKKNRSF